MRRSSKANHIINQSGQEQTYRFRCMQYLNFVLDQVVNQQNRFKLYSSHIEHLLRNNLNDITIQDIEKIKRMLDEGEKQKIQTQQTGDFINYDLIDKLKYSHDHTHYYLQQAPQQSLLQYYGPNDYTIHEVQQIKNKLKQQKLNENNYKMLDLMFKLPQDYQHLQEQIQKEIQKQVQHQQEQQQQMMQEQNHKRKTQQENEIVNEQQNDANKNPVEEIAIVNEMQKSIVVNQVENIIQQNINEVTQNRNENLIFSTPEKQNNIAPISEGSIDIPFVQIQKKKSIKKKPIPQQKPINQPIVNDNPINPQQLLVKQDKNQQNANPIQNDEDGNILTASPQKRKYIRKKPLQPKKAKSEKSKSGEKELQNRESELLEKKLELEGEIRQSIEKQIVNTKKNSQQKQKRPRKIKKIEASGKKPSVVQEIQIMLPFPQCQQQVKQLKRQLQELNKRLQSEKQQFLQNRQHALNLVTNRKSGEYEQVDENHANVQLGQVEKENNNFIKRIDNELCNKESVGVQEMRENDINRDLQNEQIQEIKVHNEINNQISNNNNNEVIIMPELLPQQQQQQQVKKQNTKKHKTAWKPNVLKNQSKKSSSQSYKPPQDEIQSVYEIEKDGKLVLIDESSDKKKTKKQKKKDNKKGTHEMTNKKTINKSNQQCVILQLGVNNNLPAQSLINSSNNSNINDNTNNNDNNNPNNNIAYPLQTTPVSLNQGHEQPLLAKQKRVKLSVQQRQRIKQQKQKLKQMRLREKQEKKKLRQLQKLQKDSMKLTHKVSEKSSAKQHKPQAAHKKSSITISQIKAINQFKKQSLQIKIDNNIQQLEVDNNNNKLQPQQHQQLSICIQLTKQKNILDESIGMNSTKEEIRMDCSLLMELDRNSISAKKKQIIEKGQVYVKSQSLEFSAIVELKQQQNGVLKREQPIQNYESRNKYSEQDDLVADIPRKKLKQLQFKEPIQYDDPQYGIYSPNSTMPKHLTQVFHPNSPPSIKHLHSSPILEQNQQQQVVNQEINQQQKIDNNSMLRSDGGGNPL